jgi:hypothetical protein
MGVCLFGGGEGFSIRRYFGIEKDNTTEVRGLARSSHESNLMDGVEGMEERGREREGEGEVETLMKRE